MAVSSLSKEMDVAQFPIRYKNATMALEKGRCLIREKAIDTIVLYDPIFTEDRKKNDPWQKRKLE